MAGHAGRLDDSASTWESRSIAAVSTYTVPSFSVSQACHGHVHALLRYLVDCIPDASDTSCAYSDGVPQRTQKSDQQALTEPNSLLQSTYAGMHLGK